MNKENQIINKQINKLKEKGLIIKDEEFAKRIILKENYENLTTGYTDIFFSLKKCVKFQQNRLNPKNMV